MPDRVLLLTLYLVAAPIGIANADISLEFDSLPSTQGWTYDGETPEASFFSVNGCVLEMDTLLGGAFTHGYFVEDEIDALRPFSAAFRVRVTTEVLGAFEPAQTFQVNVSIDGLVYLVSFAPTGLRVEDGGASQGTFYAFDFTQFRTVILSGTPGSTSYTVTVDGTAFPGTAAPTSATNQIYVGNGSGTANGVADLASFHFVQTDRPVVSFDDLEFGSLPSAQGWTYDGETPEVSFFSVNSCVLEMNTLLGGALTHGYFVEDEIDSSRAFAAALRLRVTTEVLGAFGPAQTFQINVSIDGLVYLVSFAPTGLRVEDGGASQGTFYPHDFTQFRTVVLSGTPGILGYRVTVDGTPFSGTAAPTSATNQIYLGNGSGTANGVADLTQFYFLQTAPAVPIFGPAWGSLLAILLGASGWLHLKSTAARK